MVLESLISPEKAEKDPWEMFFVGILYSSIAVFLSLYIFGGDEVSLVLVFLTVMATGVLMYRTTTYEEEEDIKLDKEYKILEQHGKALSFFMFLFLGFLVSFALWYVFLPGELSQQVFNSQIATIERINSPQVQGAIMLPYNFVRILFNNIKVLFFSLFFSFFYGMGALFILAWNASVVGAATGVFIQNLLNKALESAGALSFSHYFSAISIGLSRYLIHGIPEIGAYFIGGLAGGLISVAMINHQTNAKQFAKVLKDAFVLVVISVGILVIAALLEIYVTPLFF